MSDQFSAAISQSFGERALIIAAYTRLYDAFVEFPLLVQTGARDAPPKVAEDVFSLACNISWSSGAEDRSSD